MTDNLVSSLILNSELDYISDRMLLIVIDNMDITIN